MDLPQFADRRPLVVVTTITRWNETPRIRHQVTRQLMRFANVLYVELPFAGPSADAALEKLDSALLVLRPRARGTLLRRLRNHLRPARALHDSLVVSEVESAIERLGYKVASLVNFQFDFDRIMTSPLFSRRLYVCNDEFQGDSRFWVRALNLHAESEIARRADVTLAVSFPLLEKLQRVTSKAQLFLPGHESTIEGSGDLRDRREPVRVCCMGFLNSRLRMDWMRDLMTDGRMRLELIGPIESPEGWRELLATPGVTHHDTLVGEALQQRMREADVFIMPYDATQAAVRAITAPNKLFQYLACGRPVVCSDLPRLIELPPGFLYVAPTARVFVEQVWRAFAEDTPALRRDRLDFAAQNSWTARGDHLRDILALPAVS